MKSAPHLKIKLFWYSFFSMNGVNETLFMNREIKAGISRKQQKHDMLLNFVANVQTSRKPANAKNNFKQMLHVIMSLPKLLL